MSDGDLTLQTKLPLHPIYVSVDIETAGPYPPKFSMLQIGACDVFHPNRKFTCNLKPINNNIDAQALAISSLPFEQLKITGLDANAAMSAFADWLTSLGPSEQRRVMIGQAAPFDWQFINYYFFEFGRGNPFGFTCIDNKALFMGATGCQWSETGAKAIARVLKARANKTHDGLGDATYQAELFRGILNIVRRDVTQTGRISHES